MKPKVRIRPNRSLFTFLIGIAMLGLTPVLAVIAKQELKLLHAMKTSLMPSPTFPDVGYGALTIILTMGAFSLLILGFLTAFVIEPLATPRNLTGEEKPAS